MRLSVNLVKNLHFNSLGWQKSEMKITQLELETILSRYNFSNEKTSVSMTTCASTPDYC